MKSSPAHIVHALAACVTVLLLAPAAALAASSEEDVKVDLGAGDAARGAAESSGGGGFARMIVGLLVVLVVIYGLSWVVKQVKASKEGQAGGAGLAAVASLPLGPGRSVHLVRVGSDLVLLGAAEKTVTPIRTYSEHEARRAGLIADEDAPLLVAGDPEPARPGSGGGATGLVDLLRARTVRR